MKFFTMTWNLRICQLMPDRVSSCSCSIQTDHETDYNLLDEVTECGELGLLLWADFSNDDAWDKLVCIRTINRGEGAPWIYHGRGSNPG